MKYKNGRNLLPETIAAIRFTAKVGVLLRSTWYEFFCKGSQRWKQMQLASLVEAEILRPHTCDAIEDVYILGRYGSELVKEYNWKYATRIEPNRVINADIVGKGLWKLELAGIANKWMGEKEMKAHGLDYFEFRVRKNYSKLPCAIFSTEGKSKKEIIAVEIERTNRTSQGYYVTLQSFQNIQGIDRILFIVGNSSILRSIQMAIQKISDSEFNSKIGFIHLNDWQNNPVESVRKTLPFVLSEANTSAV